MFKIFRKLHATSCLYNLRCSFKPFLADLASKHPEPMRHFKSFATDLALAFSSDIGTEEIISNLNPLMDHLSASVKDIGIATVKFAAAAHTKSTTPYVQVMSAYTILEMDVYSQIYEYMNLDLTLISTSANDFSIGGQPFSSESVSPCLLCLQRPPSNPYVESQAWCGDSGLD